MISLSARKWSTRLCAAFVGLFMMTSSAEAQFTITFENLQGANGFALTPAWVGFHDGTFDIFNGGTAASPALEQLAELGSAALLSADFTAAGFADQGMIGAPGGFAGAPVVEPGETGMITINSSENFFSFASMLIPSNDTFVSNAFGNPTLHNVGALAPGGSLSFDVTQFYDAGTEANNPNNGSAFTVGEDATQGGAGEGLITIDDFTTFNDEFVGTNTPIGVITNPLAGPIARFTITRAVPEPGSVALFGLFGMGLALVRRRRKE